MKRSLKELKGYNIEENDGLKGKVKDFLFDEDTWTIRYLEADLGNVFSGRRVLIPKNMLREPHWENRHFPVDLTKADIENCPSLDSNLPVSRKYEQELNRYFKIENYWSYAYVPPTGVPSLTHPQREFQIPEKEITKENINTKLRSFDDVLDYHIEASDGKIGHIDDLVIDDASWQILYVIIDTGNWMPWSKKVLIPIQWIDKISYVERFASIDLEKKTIEDAPLFDPANAVNEIYEKQLYDYFGRQVE